MKKQLIICFVCILWMTPGYARDFIVEFVEEHYNETRKPFSNEPVIYHSLQVDSSAGSKVLVLTGDNDQYRTWLRYYIAQNKKFITRIEPERVDEFISSKVYSMDVTLLHPFNGDKWTSGSDAGAAAAGIEGDNTILVVDPDEKRIQLISSVIKKMGYDSLVFASARNALEVFLLHPQKFKMVLVHHSVEDMPADALVSRMIQADHYLPVIIDSGYQNQTVQEKLMSEFSNNESVHIKPVILKELPQTIERLLNKRA